MAHPARSAQIPAIGSMPIMEKLQFRLRAYLGYGRHATGQLWRSALNTGNEGLADALIGAGMVPKRPLNKDEWDPTRELMFASVRWIDDGAMTRRVLAIGGDPDRIHQNNYWDAPTHRAARCRNGGSLLAMIQHKADMTLKDGNGYTPALALLDHFGATHSSGNAADERPCTVDDRWTLVVACLAAGAEVNAATNNGYTLLSYALCDIPDRLKWVLGLGGEMDDPRTALEDTFFSELRHLGENRFLRGHSLAQERQREDKNFRWDRMGMLATLEQHGATYTGVNAQGRTFLEEGLVKKELLADDIPFLVAKGVALDVTDSEGNTLTHQLLTQQHYANEMGVALYQALRKAGLPDQMAVHNTLGQTPAEAREATMSDWFVRNAKAFEPVIQNSIATIPAPAAATPGITLAKPSSRGQSPR